MKSPIVGLIKICLYSFGFICVSNKISSAQVISDDTVNTQVNQNGNVVEITGGETRDSNLFHSFQEFSISTGNEAFFNNESAIANIFSRVTGNTVSQIEGLIRANGSANLFLINPAGIIFGENASLDIGGSFLATTANSIQFNDGEFSAIAPEEKPILTISVTIGLSFDENPGEIINNSVANERRGLEVATGNNITLLGGNINFEGGAVTAPGGRIDLGGLGAAGTVNIADDGSYTFPENVTKADLNLEAGIVDVRGSDGSININARNVESKAGDLGSSSVAAGIPTGSTVIESQAGNITIDAENKIAVDNSFISNQVQSEAVGDAGGIKINTGSLSLTNGGFIDASTFAQGNAGSVEITARDNIAIDGEDSEAFPSNIASTVQSEAVGNAGGIKIHTGSLSLTNGGEIDASTFAQGNAGAIEINTRDNISIDGEDSEAFPSNIASTVQSEAVGNAGGIKIHTGSLSLTNGGEIDASTFAQGNAGSVEITARDNIAIDGEDSEAFPSNVASTVQSEAVGDVKGVKINTGSLSLTNGGQVNAGTFGQGNAGSVEINARDNISIDGKDSESSPRGIGSQVASGAVGDAGDVRINTGFLSLTNGGQVNAGTFGQGNAGSVEINARDNISIDGEGLNGFYSAVGSRVEPEAVGSGKGVRINTDSLSLTNGGFIDVGTFGQGNAGTIEINARDNIAIDGEGSNSRSGVFSAVQSEAVGDAGGIEINTGSLSLTGGGQVNANTLGRGNTGGIKINARDNISIDGEGLDGFYSAVGSRVELGAVGNGKGVRINTGSLSLTNGGFIDASTYSRGNAGSVEITARDNIAIDGEGSNSRSGVFSTVQSEAVGDAKGVRINTDFLSLTNGGQVNAGTFGQGNAGSVEINARDNISIDGEGLNGFYSAVGSRVEPEAVGSGKGVRINTDSLSLTNGGFIDVGTFGQGNAGTIEINARDNIAIDGEGSNSRSGVFSAVQSEAVGDAGGIEINTGSLSLTGGGQVNANTLGRGNTGGIKINARDNISIDGEGLDGFYSAVGSRVELGAVGNGKGVRINTGSLSLTNGGEIDASTFAQGDAGEIKITARDNIAIHGEGSNSRSGVFSTIQSEAVGDAGGIEINTDSLSLTNGGLVSVATLGQGNAGELIVKADSLSLSNNNAEINAATESGFGGIIDLQITDGIILKNNSSISAQAFQEADGGNLNIDAGFVVALPNGNNEILASAESGRGGNITINTQGLFAPNNSITASSDLGIDGEIQINTPDINFQKELEQSELEILTAEQAIASSCLARGNQQASFTVGGNGGLPKSSSSNYSDANFSLTGVVSLPAISEESMPIPRNQNQSLIPAEKMVETADGRIFLVTAPKTAQSLFCQKN